MITIAKMIDGTIVQIIKVTETVAFSSQRGWISVCVDFEKPVHFQTNVKWIPASTKFTWVREFAFI